MLLRAHLCHNITRKLSSFRKCSDASRTLFDFFCFLRNFNKLLLVPVDPFWLPFNLLHFFFGQFLTLLDSSNWFPDFSQNFAFLNSSHFSSNPVESVKFFLTPSDSSLLISFSSFRLFFEFYLILFVSNQRCSILLNSSAAYTNSW
jgi:hypothetical protein